jgi:hypothetical protein
MKSWVRQLLARLLHIFNATFAFFEESWNVRKRKTESGKVCPARWTPRLLGFLPHGRDVGPRFRPRTQKIEDFSP